MNFKNPIYTPPVKNSVNCKNPIYTPRTITYMSAPITSMIWCCPMQFDTNNSSIEATETNLKNIMDIDIDISEAS